MEKNQLSNECRIQLEDLYQPRSYQKALFNAIENDGYRRALLVWPRRAGKDITVWHFILRQAIKKIGTYAYCLPTYSQCRSVIWSAIRSDEVRFLDMIPKGLIAKINSSDMTVTLTNGSMIRLVGSDAYDRSLVGSNPLGIVFSEFSRADPNALKYSLPILNANDGWLVVLSTPYGHNSFYELYNIGKANPKAWFVQHLTIDDTRHISRQSVDDEVRQGLISRDLAQQEYFCSFDLGVEGSFYAKYVNKMRLDGRITDCPYESHLLVHTAWDIGLSDECVILMFQIVSNTVRIIDCYHGSKVGLEHYVKELYTRDYCWGSHIGPHDLRVKDYGSGLTRLEMADRLGIKFDIAPSLSIMDGIEAVRAGISKLYIDQTKCIKLISAMENYHAEYDEKHNVYKLKPVHDRNSDWADALRYLFLGLDMITTEPSAERINERYRKAVEGNNVAYNPFVQKPW